MNNEELNIGTYGMGGRIAAIRKAKGWTQAQLAEQMSVSVQAVSKWETSAAWPDVTSLPRLASVLGVSTDWLFGLDETDPDFEPAASSEAGTDSGSQAEPDARSEAEPAAAEAGPFASEAGQPDGQTSTPEAGQAGGPDTDGDGASLEVSHYGISDVTVLPGTGAKWEWQVDGDAELAERVKVTPAGLHLKLEVERGANWGSHFSFNRKSWHRGLKVVLFAPGSRLSRFNLESRGAGDLKIALPVKEINLVSAGAGDISLDDVDGGELKVRGAGDVTIRSLGSSSLTVSGVGNVTIDEVSGALNLRQSGVGNVNLRAGQLEDLVLVKSGVGNCNASEIRITSADLSSSGVGDVSIGHITTVRRYTKSGVGNVNYR